MTARRLFTSATFERDLRRMKRQRKDLDKIESIVELLRTNATLPARCHVHPLRGDWQGHWDCHIEPDWLLIYKLPPGELILVRTGSHADLF